MNDLMKEFVFRSNEIYFRKEKGDVKNNTVRHVDIDEERFRHLIAWMELGWNDGDIKIRVKNMEGSESFVRSICDISLWGNLMIITWIPKDVLNL